MLSISPYVFSHWYVLLSVQVLCLFFIGLFVFFLVLSSLYILDISHLPDVSLGCIILCIFLCVCELYIN